MAVKPKNMRKPKTVDIDKVLADMVKAVVGAADYDIGKDLDPETAEEPEHADEKLARLVKVARKHLRVVLIKN